MENEDDDDWDDEHERASDFLFYMTVGFIVVIILVMLLFIGLPHYLVYSYYTSDEYVNRGCDVDFSSTYCTDAV